MKWTVIGNSWRWELLRTKRATRAMRAMTAMTAMTAMSAMTRMRDSNVDARCEDAPEPALSVRLRSFARARCRGDWERQGHLDRYRNCDDVWTFWVQNAEMRSSRESPPVLCDKVKIVACILRRDQAGGAGAGSGTSCEHGAFWEPAFTLTSSPPWCPGRVRVPAAGGASGAGAD